MKDILFKGVLAIVLGVGLMGFLSRAGKVYAAEANMVTFTVNASDDNTGLQYAIDSDLPEAFTDNNTFTVQAGTEHIVYVKDVAGNITTQKYTAPKVSVNEGSYIETIAYEEAQTNWESKSGSPEVEVNVEYEKKENNSNYEYITDTVLDEIGMEPEVYVQSKNTTDGTDTAEKVFYTIETASGEQFYLVIEQGNSNKVYFLNQVTTGDLMALAEEGEAAVVSTGKEEKQDNLLVALQGEKESPVTDFEDATSHEEKTKDYSSIIILALAAIGGAAYYYLKIYKSKKNDAMDAMDAMDLEEFEREEKDEEYELDFDMEDKDALLEELIRMEGEEQTKDIVEEEEVPYFATEKLEDQEREEDNLIDEKIREEINKATEYDPDLDGEE